MPDVIFTRDALPYAAGETAGFDQTRAEALVKSGVAVWAPPPAGEGTQDPAGEGIQDPNSEGTRDPAGEGTQDPAGVKKGKR